MTSAIVHPVEWTMKSTYSFCIRIHIMWRFRKAGTGASPITAAQSNIVEQFLLRHTDKHTMVLVAKVDSYLEIKSGVIDEGDGALLA